jgi:predicted N-formylglutamate amidohydrolase
MSVSINDPFPQAPEPLLTEDDPPPFRAVNPDGRAPVLLLCDHASCVVPRRLGTLGLAETDLHRHIGWDIGAADVTELLARRLDAPAVLSGFSRLVIDCNRWPDHPSAIPEASDGIPVPGNMGLMERQRRERVAACFTPYHEAVKAHLAAFARRGVTPALLMIHSFTPEMNGAKRPWHIGILWDKDPRIPVPLMRNLAADPKIVVGDNEPYSAREPAGYSIHVHAMAAGLPHALVEIRQDLIETADGAAKWAGVLAEAIEPILACTDLYCAMRF